MTSQFSNLLFYVILLLSILSAILGVLQRSKRYKKQYGSGQYGIVSTTMRGETVRSNAEKRISDYFARNNVKYVYEPDMPFYVPTPDFFLPDYGVFVEYWGLVDANEQNTREQYVWNMRRKMAKYHENNIKFISLYPNDMNNLDWAFRKKLRQVTGFDLSPS